MASGELVTSRYQGVVVPAKTLHVGGTGSVVPSKLGPVTVHYSLGWPRLYVTREEITEKQSNGFNFLLRKDSATTEQYQSA